MKPIDPVETTHKVRATPVLDSEHPFPERLAQSYNQLLKVLDDATGSDTLYYPQPYRILCAVEESS